ISAFNFSLRGKLEMRAQLVLQVRVAAPCSERARQSPKEFPERDHPLLDVPMEYAATPLACQMEARTSRGTMVRYRQARLRNEPVAGRLRRSHGVCAEPHALPPLHRGGRAAGGQRLRTPHV